MLCPLCAVYPPKQNVVAKKTGKKGWLMTDDPNMKLHSNMVGPVMGLPEECGSDFILDSEGNLVPDPKLGFRDTSNGLFIVEYQCPKCGLDFWFDQSGDPELIFMPIERAKDDDLSRNGGGALAAGADGDRQKTVSRSRY